MTDNSNPPDAKVATATGAAIANVIAILIELTIAVGASWLLNAGRLSEANWMVIAGACLVGPAASKIRGVPPIASTITVALALPAALSVAAKIAGAKWL